MRKHFPQFLAIHTVVSVFMYNVFSFTALWLLSFLLLLCWPAKYQHGGRKYIFRQIQKPALFFAVLHNISDIAGTNSQTFCRYHCILRRNHCIRHRQHQISCSRQSWLAVCFQIGIIPLLTVCTKYQYHRCLCDKWLMIASLCQCIFQILIRNI